MKKRLILHAAGLVMILLTFIPVMPGAIKIFFAFIPFALFEAEMIINYLKGFVKKDYFNEHLAFSLACLGLICTGRVTDAALTALLCSAALTVFKESYEKTQRQADNLCRIVPHRAKLITINGLKNVPLSEVTPGESIVVKKDEIIPIDGVITNGDAVIDYTNIFGPSKAIDSSVGNKCYSGGILVSGRITVKTAVRAENSIASVMEAKTRKAHNMSRLHIKVSAFSKRFVPLVLVLSLIMLIALSAATGDFGYSMNVAAVIMIASTAIGMTKVLPLIYHIALIKARRKGVIFNDTASLEALAKIQTLCPNENAPKEILDKIAETGVIPAKNPTTKLDASVYRSKASLESQKEPVYKIALGFFSPQANMTVYDSNMERIPGAIRLASTFKNAFLENTVWLIAEKLALVALVFLLNITPALAILIEFAAWMICLINSTKKA